MVTQDVSSDPSNICSAFHHFWAAEESVRYYDMNEAYTSL